MTENLTGVVLGGRYRVGPLLGTGGMGSVYEGVQTGLERKVAIKVLHRHLKSEKDLITRFQREAHAVAHLGHPNVVQISDFQDNGDDPPFIVMELLQGESLRDVIKHEQQLGAERVAYISVQILAALGAAHRANIVHRDIKPDNIFLCATTVQRDLVKVLDFGVAKLLRDDRDPKLTRAGFVVGTLAYMAPEQATGDPVDGRADLYSVGACMYFALAGRKPFDAPTTPLLLGKILKENATPLAAIRQDLPTKLCEVVQRALSKKSSERFKSADEMAAAIAQFAKPTALEITPSPSVPKPTPVMAGAKTTQLPTSSKAPPTVQMKAPPVHESAPPPAMSPQDVAAAVGPGDSAPQTIRDVTPAPTPLGGHAVPLTPSAKVAAPPRMFTATVRSDAPPMSPTPPARQFTQNVEPYDPRSLPGAPIPVQAVPQQPTASPSPKPVVVMPPPGIDDTLKSNSPIAPSPPTPVPSAPAYHSGGHPAMPSQPMLVTAPRPQQRRGLPLLLVVLLVLGAIAFLVIGAVAVLFYQRETTTTPEATATTVAVVPVASQPSQPPATSSDTVPPAPTDDTQAVASAGRTSAAPTVSKPSSSTAPSSSGVSATAPTTYPTPTPPPTGTPTVTTATPSASAPAGLPSDRHKPKDKPQ